MAYAVPGQQRPQPGIDFAIISEAFSYLWTHWKVYCIAGGIIFLIGMPGQIISSFPLLEQYGTIGASPIDEATGSIINLAMMLPVWIVSMFMQVGIVNYTLKVRRGEPCSSNDLWEGFKDPLGYIWAGFLMTIVSMLGFIACCVGVFVTIGLMMFVLPAKVDQRISGSDAVAESWNMLKSEWFMVAVFSLVIGLISSLGYIACCVGIVFTMPFMYVAQTLLYCNYKGYFPQQSYAPSNSPYPRSGQPGYGAPQQPGGVGGPVPPTTDTTDRPNPRPEDPLSQPPYD